MNLNHASSQRKAANETLTHGVQFKHREENVSIEIASQNRMNSKNKHKRERLK